MSPVRTAGKSTAPARFSAFSRRWFYGIIVFLVVVAAVVATALVVDARRTPHLAAADQVPEATPAVIAAPVEPAVDAATVESVLAGPAGDGALGTLTGEVTDAATGTSLWSRDQGTLLVPASSAKLTTATAALLTLPTDDRVPTTVARGTEPGQIVLRGGGDITLQRTPGSGFFTDAASVSDLADQARTALAGDKVTSVIVDNSLREGDLFNLTWSTDDIGAGNVAPLSAVMIDAGRIDPTQNYSPRSGTPAADVGHALAESLGVADVPVSVSDTPVEMTGDLATVYSATLGIRFRDMMLHSDNLLAESIGREVAAARNRPGTFDGATGAVLATLAEAGVDVSGAVLRDCSGMSADDRLSAKILDSVLALAAGSPMAGQATTDDRAAELRLLFDSLPVSGVDGTLADRYLPGSGAEGAAGRVRAKTGTLDGVNTLAGTVTTDSGKVLTFAFLSNGSDMDAGRAALDRLAAALRKA